MSGESYGSLVVIPLLIVVMLGYYSYRLLVLHDLESIRGKYGKKVKDKEKYTKEAGKLMVFLAAGSLLMAGILYFSKIAAFVELCVCVIIFGILWKKMNDKYGE